MLIKCILFVLVVAPIISSEKRIQLIDITPEEAQKLITQQSLDLRYATKLSERSANGNDGGDYVEETYEANQFHGQDGLGRAIFGYTDNQQSRLEARNVNGEVRGQYQYIDPWGNDIQVQYWSDNLGFHQSDNHPTYDQQSVTETPEVRQAREEHEKLWKEAARLNGIDPDASDYNPNVDRFENDDDSDDDDDSELEGQVSNQHQSLTRYPVLPYSAHIVPENAKTFGRVVDDSVIVDSVKRYARQQNNEVEEVTSEPRGFFYSFDYPVAYLRSLSDAQASENVEQKIDFLDETLRRPLELHDVHSRPIVTYENRVQRQTGSSSVKVNKDVKTQPEQHVDQKKIVKKNRGSIKFNTKSISSI